MDILGRYEDKYCLPFHPDESSDMIFDGAAIGQYVSGIDVNNIPNVHISGNKEKFENDNPTKGFVNETSVFKPNSCIFSRTLVTNDNLAITVKAMTCLAPNRNNLSLLSVANVHVHSKQLHQLSSVFDVEYNDIITGDRVLRLCDFVIATKQIYMFHKNMDKYTKDVILIKDFNNVNIPLLNKYFREHCVKHKKTVVKLFIYTHIFKEFSKKVFIHLDNDIKYVFYLHNSDHSFDATYERILNTSNVLHIYAQNVNYPEYNNKLTLLPIGIANSMWGHGDLTKFYAVMKDTYKFKKTRSLYVNINPHTFSFRKTVLDAIVSMNAFPLSQGKPYLDYLTDLASHRFCLCLRGNGIDTHRFWESLYLGVIPVIVNNKFTDCQNFIVYLRQLDVPFVEIKQDDIHEILSVYNEMFFNEHLYKTMIHKQGKAMLNITTLKMSNYVYDNL
jgi:hypothetical protein